MKKILPFIKNFEELIASICLAIMTSVSFINVILRYFFHSPLIWGDEFAMLMMTWAVFLGISAAFKRNIHLGMEFFVNKLSKNKRLILEGILMIICFILFAFLAIVSLVLILKTMKKSQIIGIPYGYIYCAPLIGFTSMTVYSLIYLYRFFFLRDKFALRYEKEETQ